MHSKIVTPHTQNTARTAVLVLQEGEEIIESLLAFATEHGVRGASFAGIGAVDRCTLGFYDRERGDYDEIHLDEQLEVLSVIGNISLFEDAPRIHAHIVLGDAAGNARGGHLLSAQVWPTLEITVELHDEPLVRTRDATLGLPLLTL